MKGFVGRDAGLIGWGTGLQLEPARVRGNSSCPLAGPVLLVLSGALKIVYDVYDLYDRLYRNVRRIKSDYLGA